MCYVEIKEKQTALCEIRQKSQDRDKSQRRIKLDLIEEAVVAGGGCRMQHPATVFFLALHAFQLPRV